MTDADGMMWIRKASRASERAWRYRAALREREQQLREARKQLARAVLIVDENKELRRLLDEVGLDRAGIAGELSAVEQQLGEAREVLHLIEEYKPGTKGATLRYIKERAAALGEGAKG